MKRIGILTSGGDTPGMNAAIRAVLRTGVYYGNTVLGVYHGFQGLVEGRIQQLHSVDLHGSIQRGGTVLRTARSQEFITEAGRKKALSVIRAYGIDVLVVVGGDGSFRGALKLAEEGVNVMGLPGTIDNDMGYTDFTIGFDTAVNNVMMEMEKIRDTMRSHDRVAVVEVMGRACGDIALWSALTAPADIVLTPEAPRDWADAAQQLADNKIKGRLTSLVIIAEGAGRAEDFAAYVREHTDVDIRAIVLSYIQRGGSPSAADRMLASRLGARAVELIEEGQVNRAVGIRDNHIVDINLADAIEMQDQFDYGIYDLHGMLNRIY